MTISCCCVRKLEYLAVYGRASMATFRQLSTHNYRASSQQCARGATKIHTVKSLTLNPYMSLLNLKLCNHIWSTNINFRPTPLTLDFLVRLGLTLVSPWMICGRGWSIGPATIFFVTDRNVTT